MFPVLFWVAGGEAAVQAVDHWSATPQPADLTLERCLRIQPGHKSFISLCLITSLWQWSSVTTHLQAMVLWSVYRSGPSQTACAMFVWGFFLLLFVSHTISITFVMAAVRILQGTDHQDCSVAKHVLVTFSTANLWIQMWNKVKVNKQTNKLCDCTHNLLTRWVRLTT